MALEIRRPKGPPQGLVADRRLYLTREGGNVDGQPGPRMVEDGDPAAAFLLATPGWVIPAEDVSRLGLELVDGRIEQRRAKPVVAAPAAEELKVAVDEAKAPAKDDDAKGKSKNKRGE